MRKLTVIYYEILCAWLLSLSMMFSSLIHVVACPPLPPPRQRWPPAQSHIPTVGASAVLRAPSCDGIFPGFPRVRGVLLLVARLHTVTSSGCFCSFMSWLCPQAAAAETLPDPGRNSVSLSGVSVSSAAKQIGSNRPEPCLLLKPLSLGF